MYSTPCVRSTYHLRMRSMSILVAKSAFSLLHSDWLLDATKITFLGLAPAITCNAEGICPKGGLRPPSLWAMPSAKNRQQALIAGRHREPHLCSANRFKCAVVNLHFCSASRLNYAPVYLTFALLLD